MKLQFEMKRPELSGVYEVEDTEDPNRICEIGFDLLYLKLVSQGVLFRFDLNKNKGYIFAGFHCIGKFWIVKQEKGEETGNE